MLQEKAFGPSPFTGTLSIHALFFYLRIMYPLSLVLLLLLLLNIPCPGQKTPDTKQNLYIIKVLSLNKTAFTNNGVLYALNDSSISLLENVKKAKKGEIPGESDILTLPVSNIQQISIRKHGSRTRGAIIGGVLGGLVGGLIGNMVYKPCDNTNGSWFGCIEIFDQRDHVLFGAFLGIGAGSAVGYGIATPRKFIIFRDQQTYLYLKDSLASYLYRPPALQELEK